MRFDFFENLSRHDANAFLKRFLEEESLNVKVTAKICAAERVKMDYSINSIPRFMRWVLKRLTTIALEPDPAVPEWIRNTDSYTKHLSEFDAPSKELVLQAAYYLGESFVRSHKTLRWGTGNIKMAEANMPVVTGFRNEDELAPILIADNLLGRIIAEPKKVGDIERAVESWNAEV